MKLLGAFALLVVFYLMWVANQVCEPVEKWRDEKDLVSHGTLSSSSESFGFDAAQEDVDERRKHS